MGANAYHAKTLFFTKEPQQKPRSMETQYMFSTIHAFCRGCAFHYTLWVVTTLSSSKYRVGRSRVDWPAPPGARPLVARRPS